MDRAGRIVVPKALREELYLKAGDELDIVINGRGFSLVPIRPRARMVHRNGVWVRVTGQSADYDPVEEVDKSRLEREQQILGHAAKDPGQAGR